MFGVCGINESVDASLDNVGEVLERHSVGRGLGLGVAVHQSSSWNGPRSCGLKSCLSLDCRQRVTREYPVNCLKSENSEHDNWKEIIREMLQSNKHRNWIPK